MNIKLLEHGILPKKGRDGDSAWDIFLPKDIEINPHSTIVVDLGVCVEIPNGFTGMLVIRSSISKKGILVQPPLIDSNYRGEIHLVAFNMGDEIFKANKNDRICSLLVFPILNDSLNLTDELSESNRGTNWSGSSGK